MLTLKKIKTLRQYFNRSEQCLTYRYLQKISHKQADDQFMPIPKRQGSDLDPTDLVKQTVGQVLPLKRPKHAYNAKLAQHLALHEPMRLASTGRLSLSSSTLKLFIAL